MRKLQTADICAAVRCIKELDIRDQVEKLAKEHDTVKDAFSAGFDLIWDIFDKATEKKGEKSLYKFLAGVMETTPEEIEKLPPADFIAEMKQLAEENDLVGFFNSVKGLMK